MYVSLESTAMTGLPITATTTWVLNPTRCHLRTIQGKGRGVFGTIRSQFTLTHSSSSSFSATQTIPARTVIETSPVLLFSKQEYDDHGRHTLLDHYTFNSRDGRMALALGLGSLFNHAENPNVSFSVDIVRERIVYTSTRAIQPDEELCIFYGHQLWFDPVDGPPSRTSDLDENTDSDAWGGLADIQGHTDDNVASASFENVDNIVTEDDLPFTWKKLSLEKEEEQLDDIELGNPTPRSVIGPLLTHSTQSRDGSSTYPIQPTSRRCSSTPTPFPSSIVLTCPPFRWLKQAGLDKDALSHLKRIRRQAALSTLLLDTSPDPPPLPPESALERPYQLPVPRHPARTPTSLALKNTYWPTVLCPRRKWEPEPWTMARVRWASDAVDRLKRAYTDAVIAQNGEVGRDPFMRIRMLMCRQLPVVVHVPIPHPDPTQLSRPFFAYDTRMSTSHPLRHAALDVIRQIADDRAAQPGDEAAKNGAQYLLTGLSLFITHEPCVMCTMALLHSRVKEVFYLVPMPRTGGCGGLTCIPSLKGVNHRFSIGVWKEDPDWPDPLDPTIDV
ncbi:hypothetical protein JVT61DRAFT_977 [Boletus reticuloceps]|uniref:SET domain-containing protein n=1 Tax=Boletus reticuloceps TaxID=495285 RepID=A0A8I3A9J9_9AGAM|nr:hypothetical protein JVT61DRAFT_977 [Boletus reticuloceps]